MTGATTFKAMLSDWFAEPALFDTVIVAVKEPLTVETPEIIPEDELMLSPAGNPVAE
jgi:hypothetical protein